MNRTPQQLTLRRGAIEKMMSPDRLDALPAVAHQRRWMFRLALALLALAGLLWSLLGLVETRVAGRCIIISPSGVAEITSSGEGRVSDLNVRIGQQVAANELIATIRTPAFDSQLRKAEERLAELKSREGALRRLLQRSATEGARSASAERSLAVQRLATLKERRELLEKRLAAQQQLRDEGLVTRQKLLATEQQLADNQIQIDQLLSQEKALDFQQEEETRQRQNELAALALQVNEAEREIHQLRQREQDMLQVRTPFAGRIVEIKADNGQLVSFGRALVVVERDAGTTDGAIPLAALVFVPGGPGKLVQPGMAAEVTPTTVKRQEFGFVRARVEHVSDFPSSQDSIQQLIQNPNIVKELVGSGAPVVISTALTPDAKQGYVWSAAAGTPPPVRSGTLCNAEVRVRSQHPYELFWPLIKKVSGWV